MRDTEYKLLGIIMPWGTAARSDNKCMLIGQLCHCDNSHGHISIASCSISHPGQHMDCFSSAQLCLPLGTKHCAGLLHWHQLSLLSLQVPSWLLSCWLQLAQQPDVLATVPVLPEVKALWESCIAGYHPLYAAASSSSIVEGQAHVSCKAAGLGWGIC